MSTYDIDKTE